MVYTTYLWWIWGWIIVVLPTLIADKPSHSPTISQPSHSCLGRSRLCRRRCRARRCRGGRSRGGWRFSGCTCALSRSLVNSPIVVGWCWLMLVGFGSKLNILLSCYLTIIDVGLMQVDISQLLLLIFLYRGVVLFYAILGGCVRVVGGCIHWCEDTVHQTKTLRNEYINIPTETVLYVFPCNVHEGVRGKLSLLGASQTLINSSRNLNPISVDTSHVWKILPPLSFQEKTFNKNLCHDDSQFFLS